MTLVTLEIDLAFLFYPCADAPQDTTPDTPQEETGGRAFAAVQQTLCCAHDYGHQRLVSLQDSLLDLLVGLDFCPRGPLQPQTSSPHTRLPMT